MLQTAMREAVKPRFEEVEAFLSNTGTPLHGRQTACTTASLLLDERNCEGTNLEAWLSAPAIEKNNDIDKHLDGK